MMNNLVYTIILALILHHIVVVVIGFQFTIHTRQQQRLLSIKGDSSKSNIFINNKLKQPSIWRKLKTIFQKKEIPGRLILIRHGESEMNSNSTFTGWIDCDITEIGKKEMEHATRLLLESGYIDIDVVYCSMLKRCIKSTWILLKVLKQVYRPVIKSWRLNQRMYGSLEGLTYDQLSLDLGPEKVKEYRKSLYATPPPMLPSHPFSHFNKRQYQEISQQELPVAESIYDCWNRLQPLVDDNIVPDLLNGKNVLVCAHENSLKGLIRYFDNLSDEEVNKIVIPSGSPFVYKFSSYHGRLAPIKQENTDVGTNCTNFSFIENKKILKMLLEKESQWGIGDTSEYRGRYSLIDYSQSNLLSPMMQGLSILNEERKILSDENDKEAINVLDNSATPLFSHSNSPTVQNQDQLLVLIRHGKTIYNELGMFTGWDDAELAANGYEEAKRAGQILKMHNFQFDIVYTSWLSRAIETAWEILTELDCLWLPMIKSWRLNERMYGALTAMSKKGIAEKYGEFQMKAWRRGYSVRPPPVDSFSSLYPGNDNRYSQYVSDLPISKLETVVRSISKRKFEIHRKFPKTESLRDCMKRTIPYYKDVIVPNSIKKGKRVLIASSENAIRGLLMHLCDIPEHRIHEIDIPNGVPLIYNIKKRCIQLLDDGLHTDDDIHDPLRRYNFGASPELLFKPCDLDDESNIDTCIIGEDGRTYSYDPIIRLK